MSDTYTLDSLAPYIEGRKFLGEAKKATACSRDCVVTFLTMVAEDPIAADTLKNTEVASDFYKIMIDFNHFIPKEQRKEVYYAAKLGGEYYAEIPPFCHFMLKKCYEQCNGLPNLIMKVMPVSCFNVFLAEGYFGSGLSLRDAICNVCNEEYTPVSLTSPKCRHELFTEFYVASTDMIAAIPNDIADDLPNACCEKIEVTGAGLAIDGVLIRTMRERIGAINSIYDLRELL